MMFYPEESSIDDALEAQRPNKAQYHLGQPELDEDNDPPAAPFDDTDEQMPEDHPSNDTNVDATERYNA